MFPLVGAAIGGAVGLLFLGMRAVGVPDLAAAALALGASAILTGALHEDGLADVADWIRRRPRQPRRSLRSCATAGSAPMAR